MSIFVKAIQVIDSCENPCHVIQARTWLQLAKVHFTEINKANGCHLVSLSYDALRKRLNAKRDSFMNADKK